ncbi:MAG: hypothetical protein HLUCCO16_13090 [Phormidium sp. OSCR]|nr:MAG: hypothetical protein HLUCCO16_13090 [Phormidium sp. OSCR]
MEISNVKKSYCLLPIAIPSWEGCPEGGVGSAYSLFPIPYSLFPVPYSLFPIPS